uniref:Putative ovule protein n=1 Tax=Solanum chacoense TaxID=4108 RepID=A0A0V0GUX1_SOLCH
MGKTKIKIVTKKKENVAAILRGKKKKKNCTSLNLLKLTREIKLHNNTSCSQNVFQFSYFLLLKCFSNQLIFLKFKENDLPQNKTKKHFSKLFFNLIPQLFTLTQVLSINFQD